ncbi:ABC-type transport auxiliary lipoprotein family protein [uncultured Cohaesibacter sp.]|uniref:ABC-type transport auxiliary lipoprotein family protein n=1 Tax=uncultured Cohaesibacter sp. TaxID=1002546 RepID=UPI002AA6931D|nr:ABC-type transport auxiliary lipoprotein family protein [uncultured Cohaesibacter sp.]
MSSATQFVRILSSVCLALWLSSCSVVGGGKELTTYDLSAPTNFENLRGRSNAQLLISEPTALKSLDSEMIVVRPDAAEITYFGDAQWSDSLPNVLQDKLIQTFENSGRMRSVVKPGDGVVVDYKLATSIRSFELNDANQPVAKIALSVKIINDRNGRVVASRLFQASSPASSATPAKGVAALDRALDSVLNDILVWTLKAI